MAPRTVVLYEGSFYVGLYRRLLIECRECTQPLGRRRAPAHPEVIRLDGVSFAYPGHERPTLRNIDLEIRRGQVVALVGENGSGKTTLAKSRVLAVQLDGDERAVRASVADG